MNQTTLVKENNRSRTASRKIMLSWAFYDWANQSFPTVIQTFVFAAYFTRRVAENEALGTAQWGYVLAVSGLIVAFGGPILGAVADQWGRRKPWIELDRESAQHVRATFVLAAAWYLFFAVPLFLFTPEVESRGKRMKQAVRDGLRQLVDSMRHIREYRNIVKFLIARMIYILC
jgi:MFS-type transporter involved in bile tolerance (Atg22 family)